MKIGVFSIPQITPGKHNVKDPRLDEVDKITKSKKKTYVQIETVAEELYPEADAIMAPQEFLADLILRDMEFVETRLGRSVEEAEKALLAKLKAALEKEELIFKVALSDEEKKMISGYSLLTSRPVVILTKDELEHPDNALGRVLREAGFISFFTIGEKETRAWLIARGTTAWEAAGAVHSDMQKGFIRAEIITFEDFISSGGETAAKQAGKQRLEQKDYLMQDADLVNFRFNK